jgi:hypothetical protein
MFMDYTGMPVSNTELLSMVNAALQKSPWDQYVASKIIQIYYPFGSPRVMVAEWEGETPRYPDLVHAMVVSAFDDVELKDATAIHVVSGRTQQCGRRHTDH